MVFTSKQYRCFICAILSGLLSIENFNHAKTKVEMDNIQLLIKNLKVMFNNTTSLVYTCNKNKDYIFYNVTYSLFLNLSGININLKYCHNFTRCTIDEI